MNASLRIRALPGPLVRDTKPEPSGPKARHPFAWVCVAALWLAGLSAHAADNDPVSFGATIAESVRVSARGIGAPFTTELSLSDTSDATVADLVISSNGPNGFQITLSSLNAGRLVREGGDPMNDADFAPYRLDLEPQPGGLLGTAVPPPQQRRDLDLALGDETIRFEDNVTGPTVDKSFVLEIHTQAKPGLFAGTYSDVVTVTIEDL